MDPRSDSVRVLRTEFLHCVNYLWSLVSSQSASNQLRQIARSTTQHSAEDKVPSIESSRPAVSIDQPMRRSINFMEEWQSSSSVPVSTPTPIRSRSSSINPTLSELGDPEDLMLAFHGFESAGVRPPVARSRPRRSQSTGVDSVSSPSQGIRSSSVETSNIRVTRSGREYGARSRH
jgi:hypothetical protein